MSTPFHYNLPDSAFWYFHSGDPNTKLQKKYAYFPKKLSCGNWVIFEVFYFLKNIYYFSDKVTGVECNITLSEKEMMMLRLQGYKNQAVVHCCNDADLDINRAFNIKSNYILTRYIGE